MSMVQRSHHLAEAEDSPVTSSALQKVINAFFKRIFTNTNNAWIDTSTKLSAFVMLHETTPHETKINGFDLFDKMNVVACVAYFSADENMFINCLAVNTIDKPNSLIKNRQKIQTPSVTHNKKAKTTNSTKWSVRTTQRHACKLVWHNT